MRTGSMCWWHEGEHVCMSYEDYQKHGFSVDLATPTPAPDNTSFREYVKNNKEEYFNKKG